MIIYKINQSLKITFWREPGRIRSDFKSIYGSNFVLLITSDIDAADLSNTQDAYHMNFVIDLAPS